MTGAQRTACSQYLARRASEVLGITATGGIFLPEQDLQLPPLRLHLEPIRLLDDVPDRLALDMEIILQPSDPRLAARVRQPLATFTQQLQQAVEHWLMRSCRLSTFCFDKANLQRISPSIWISTSAPSSASPSSSSPSPRSTSSRASTTSATPTTQQATSIRATTPCWCTTLW
ncbi:hypothetical protein [Verrucomicrobium spinosum]|uniref:hypothetical protein n=1 Tax=Verrucomicrobium spinosum TaxID=2736 RepID=UPI000A53A6DD|nr:hypothetical protein [Verrucomicrobium spinosum]